MRIIPAVFVLAAGTALLALPASADEHRQLGAHVHGHGRLSIAIEGTKVSMELEVPGMDIVGFEHEPSTPEQKAAVADGKQKLLNALVLFGPAPQAGCKLQHVKVSTEAEHEDEHEHEAHGGAAGHEEEPGHHHSEFHAEYTLTCSSPSRLTSMSFEYFNAFAGAQELDVAVIAPKGQSSFEVTRGKPSLDLTPIM